MYAARQIRLALVHRQPGQTARTYIIGFGADKAAAHLRDDMRRPAGDARQGKERREHIDIQVERIQGDGAVIIDIGEELALDEVVIGAGGISQLGGNIEPFAVAAAIG